MNKFWIEGVIIQFNGCLVLIRGILDDSQFKGKELEEIMRAQAENDFFGIDIETKQVIRRSELYN